jgi:hypothetical protein
MDSREADMKKSSRIAICTIAPLVAWLAVGAHSALAAGLYKWTDDKGVIHYSDQMPPDAVNKGTVVFDKQGRQVKKIDAAPTAEQLKAKEEEAERLQAVAREREGQNRRDMALLQSYTNENEIELARNRAMAAVASQIKSIEIYMGDLSRRQQELDKQKAALAGKPMPAVLENELNGINEELGRQGRLLTQKKEEVSTVNARYDLDKRRWQEIKADQARASALGLEPATKPAAKPGSNAATTAAK